MRRQARQTARRLCAALSDLSFPLYQKKNPNATSFSFRAAQNGRGTAHATAANRLKLSLSLFFQRKWLFGSFFSKSSLLLSAEPAAAAGEKYFLPRKPLRIAAGNDISLKKTKKI